LKVEHVGGIQDSRQVKQEDIQEVWRMLDRERLAEITAQGPRPVFATISGAHLYGFASPDSDVDLRGAFLLPAEEILSIDPPKETITIEENTDIELDWVAHDLRKFARMMVSHNGYVMEQLFSPLVVVTTELHEQLMEVARGCITRPMVRHYLGFARGRRKRLEEPDATVKHLLYAYRVYLSGIHLMQTGAIESNLAALNEAHPLPEVEELIARKRAGAEHMQLRNGELLRHTDHLDLMEARLHAAHAESSLPEEPTTAAELNALVVRVRLED
jgi:predicted nucleotidyltransferase